MNQAPFKALLTAMRNGGGGAGEEEGGRGSGTAVLTSICQPRNQQCILREGMTVGEAHSCDCHFSSRGGENGKVVTRAGVWTVVTVSMQPLVSKGTLCVCGCLNVTSGHWCLSNH